MHTAIDNVDLRLVWPEHTPQPPQAIAERRAPRVLERRAPSAEPPCGLSVEHRATGSLSGLLRVHLSFELVRGVWTSIGGAAVGGAAVQGASAAGGGVEEGEVADGLVKAELRMSEAELIEASGSLGDDELASLNDRLQA